MSTSLLLFLHLAGAFLFVGGALAAGALRLQAMRARAASEVALLLRAVRPLVAAIGLGLLLAVVFGAALAHRLGDAFGSAWLVATYVLLLWIVLVGGATGRQDRRTRERAEELARENGPPSPELAGRLRNPLNLALNASLLLAVSVIVALMVWRP